VHLGLYIPIEWRRTAEEREARAHAAAVATQQAVAAGLTAARVGRAITHMRGIRPDIVANDTTNASARILLEAKTMPRGQD
jgi:hypothetical protein